MEGRISRWRSVGDVLSFGGGLTLMEGGIIWELLGVIADGGRGVAMEEPTGGGLCERMTAKGERFGGGGLTLSGDPTPLPGMESVERVGITGELTDDESGILDRTPKSEILREGTTLTSGDVGTGTVGSELCREVDGVETLNGDRT
jgi:hypothetical protein